MCYIQNAVIISNFIIFSIILLKITIFSLLLLLFVVNAFNLYSHHSISFFSTFFSVRIMFFNVQSFRLNEQTDQWKIISIGIENEYHQVLCYDRFDYPTDWIDMNIKAWSDYTCRFALLADKWIDKSLLFVP